MARAARVAAAAVLVAAGCKGVSTLAPSGAVIRMFASPDVVATGGQASLSISVFEASGQPVPDETVVNLTTTLGRLEPKAVETVGGRAEATFFAGGQTGDAEITAMSGSTSETITVVIGGAASITMAANPAVLPIGGGSTTISATVLDLDGNPERGAVVTFSTDTGSLASGGAPRATGSNGVASDTLTTVGDAVVTGVVTGAMVEGTVAVDVLGTGVESLDLSASPTTLPAGGGRSTLVAQAFDDDGVGLAGVPIVFKANAGSIVNAGPRFTDGSGVATNAIDTDVTATVTATTGAVGDDVQITVEATPADALQITLSVEPDPTVSALTTPMCPMPRTGCSGVPGECFEIVLTAEVRYLGEPLAGAGVIFIRERLGTSPAFDTSGTSVPNAPGNFCGPSTAVTGADGRAVVYYNLALSEQQQCNSIVTPCMPAVTSCSVVNRCCCGLRFTARVDVAEDEVDYPMFAQQLGPPPRLCACTF